MSLQEGIIFVLCVGNGVRFCGEKVLCLDAHIDLRSNNHCLVHSPWASYPTSMPKVL